MIYIILILLALPFLLLGLLSITAKVPETGLVDGQLRPCPNSPNCVSSEEEKGRAYIKPLDYDSTAAEAWDRLKNAVQAIGGRIEADQDHYLRATFRTAIYRFVDDLECRLDPDNNVIHLRSASRAGHSDLGVNRKRVERLRERF